MNKTLKISNTIQILGYELWVIEAVKAALTIDNPAFFEAAKRLEKKLLYVSPRQKQAIIKKATAAIPQTIESFSYEEGSSTIEVPRGFLFSFLELCQSCGLEPPMIENITACPTVSLRSKIQLRSYQEPFVSAIVKNPNGIAVAAPGAGKTQSALEVAARLGVKTLWITHTSALANQTRARIEKCLDVESIGSIGSGKFSIGDITVALVQTLFRRDLSVLKNEFGLVIVDECHHTPARTFFGVLSQFNARYIIGLSATPYRRDGLEQMMYQYLGPKIVEIEKEELVKLGHLVRPRVVQSETGVVVRESISEYQDIMEEIYKSQSRVNQIAKDAYKEAKASKVCIVLVDSIQYGKKISAAINKLGINSNIVYSTESKTERGKTVILSRMSAKKREEIFEEFRSGALSVLVATYDLLSEGFDYEPLNRLFLASPLSNKNKTLIEQSCGRVSRSFPGKEDALIFDYVDSHPMCAYQAAGRLIVFKELGMDIM